MKQLITRLRGSLRAEILVIYAALALSTIIFFSTIILENQSDLLLDLFRFQSRDVTQEMGRTLRAEKFDPARPEFLVREMQKQSVRDFVVLDAKGACVYPAGCTTPPGAQDVVKTLISESALFRTDSHIALDADSGTASFVLALDDAQKYFLRGSMRVSAMEIRMSQVSRQIWLVMAWMVLFNIAFAVYLYRRIFSRVDRLKAASERMTAGKLDARAEWNFRTDELDNLGRAFNEMAGTIEQQVNEISRLNSEMQEELIVGRDVQQIFLTERDQIAARGIAMHFQPLREVSGDVYFFDTQERGGKKFDIYFLADATGHGVPAALITSILLLSLREALSQTIHPGKVLALLSQLMYDRLQSQYYATGCIFLRDPSGRMHYASGGHPPPLWYRPSTGQILELEATGPMLGLLEGMDFEAKTIPSLPGDRFLIYSDRVTEGARESEMFGMSRVQEYLLSSKTPEDLVQSLWAGLDAFVDRHTDDVTIFSFDI